MPTRTIMHAALPMVLSAMLCACQPEESTERPVTGADPMKFADETGCLACHSLDKKLLGPAWRHVAGVYRNDPAAEARLMDKIARGGSGVWGSIDMPAYPWLAETDRRMLARFILSLE